MKITVFWAAIVFCSFTTLTATAQTWDLCREVEMDRGCWTHRGHPMDPYPRCVCPNFREVTSRFIASGTASVAWSAPEQTAINEMNRNANKACHQKSYSGAFRATKIDIIDAGTFIAARSEFRCWRN